MLSCRFIKQKLILQQKINSIANENKFKIQQPIKYVTLRCEDKALLLNKTTTH